MKLYLEDKDIGKTVTFTDEKRQGLYVHDDKDGFIFKSLAEHDELLIKNIEEKYDKLAERFAIVSKALDLACEDLLDNDVSMCEYCEKTGNCIDECPTDKNSEMYVLLNYFIKKAKEIINGYKPND